MTRSVTIVNTSNWEHEDMEVIPMVDGWPREHRVLAPGDSMVGGPNGPEGIVSYLIRPRTRAEPVPFKDAEGNQDWPKVEIHKPKPSKPE